MRLIQKTNINYLILSTILFVVAGFISFKLISDIVREETSEKLVINKDRIVKELENGNIVSALPPILEVEEIFTGQSEMVQIKDTVLYDPVEMEEELFREVIAIKNINGITYRITVRQAIVESNDFLNSIGLSLLIVLVLLLISLYFVNRSIARNIWKPFNRNLEELRKFSIQKDDPLKLSPSGIIEFEELNRTISNLTKKVQSDYHSLKEFTENASHEMQTPLTIIQNNLEEAMQTPNIPEEVAARIETVYKAIRRLSKLNKGLLLLTKIENKQFETVEQLKPALIIDELLEQYDSIIQARPLYVAKKMDSDFVVETNSYLLFMVLSNLLSNAIKHSSKGTQIEIVLDSGVLTIENSGPELSVVQEKLFERFFKGDPSSESIGLGLAIVRKICDLSEWSIQYTNEGAKHKVRINFIN
ncbi:MAG: HAMP domain-containing histidine kinase [Bacteroidales bacterium]|nr:HAMP domain-containing histidine kinase [Bacteroidales bacterium]